MRVRRERRIARLDPRPGASASAAARRRDPGHMSRTRRRERLRARLELEHERQGEDEGESDHRVTRQFRVTAPGVIELAVGLHTLKLIPLVDG